MHDNYWYVEEGKASPTSLDYKNQLQELLSVTSLAVNDLYDSLKIELENEILGVKVKGERADQETNDFFNLLNYDICTKIIKKKLPLRIRLFTKVTCHGYGVRDSGRIMIAFSFNDLHNNFEYNVSIKEIRRLMNWN